VCEIQEQLNKIVDHQQYKVTVRDIYYKGKMKWIFISGKYDVEAFRTDVNGNLKQDDILTITRKYGK
jgi:hypothetical protein